LETPLKGRLILPKQKELNMQIIGPLSLNDLCSNSNPGNGNSPAAFKSAIKSLLMPGSGNLPASTPQTGSSPFNYTTLMPQSTFYDPSTSRGDDNYSLDHTVSSDQSEIQSLLSRIETILNNEEAAAANPPPAPADPSSADSSTPPPNTPPDTSNWTPQQFQTALQNGTATGNPPDNLTLPPGTTAADVATYNGGLLNNLNKLHLQDGTPAGDAAAQKYGYKDMKTLLADKSPQAAAAAGKILWAARACNNMKEADGADRPAKEQSANTLSGITSKHQADNGSTSGAFQNWLEKGTSIQSQHVFATKRTHADGEGMTNAQIIGNRIAGVFKKIFSAICPPISDLIQMAQDGAEKIRDNHVGDKDAAAHDTAAIKHDGKNFGKDFGEFAANAALMLVPGAGEAALAARGAADVAETGAKDAAESGAKDAAKSGTKDPASDASQGPDVSSLKDKLQNLLFGDDFKSQLTGLPKDATPQEIMDHVKKKLKHHLNDLLQQLAPPPQRNGNDNAAQSSQIQLLAQLEQLLMLLQSSNPTGERT
jgi:hypothetical protein